MLALSSRIVLFVLYGLLEIPVFEEIFGSSGVSGDYNLAFAATRFAASTWPRGPETLASCHNCMSHQELGLPWA
ncbi:MAG: hypothetical protein ABSE84_24760, partial [Isosphaeraceae bacterium]